MSRLNLIQILEAERLELKETQEVFVERFEISTSQYSATKSGRAKLPAKCLQLVAEFLGMPVNDAIQMNEELKTPKLKKEKVTRRRTYSRGAVRSYLSGFTQEEIETWKMGVTASHPNHLRAHLWYDARCQSLSGDEYLECGDYPHSMSPEKLYKTVQAAIEAGALWNRNAKFVIVDFQGMIQYDGSREEPWAPWLVKRWMNQI
jgi:transcriptional regulator with XRE-family HTH domain